MVEKDRGDINISEVVINLKLYLTETFVLHR